MDGRLQADPRRAPPVFVAVGRFVPKKAPFLTLTAFERVLEQHPSARLEMIGDGPLLSACQQLARGLGVEAAVTFRGATSHEQVYETLASARCFVQHSVTAPDGDREGTPVAVLEAMAAGLPVVTTRHTGIADVVVDGRTGTLVSEYDTRGMARAMLTYADDPELADQTGRAGHDSVRRRWSLEKSIDQLLSILSDAARSHPVAD